jgi:SWI/SNF-related matrix-associated actin-dependent regulator of chromatin subfamily A-like protein 1
LSRDRGNVRAYQTHGIRWIAGNLKSGVRAVLLCDAPGVGKTIQALMAADQLQARRILVVSPAGARRVWLQEIGTWFPEWAGRVVIVEPGNYPTLTQLDAEDAIVLVSYDSLSITRRGGANPWADHLTERGWDLLIIDEAHYLKSGGAKRTQAIYGKRGTDGGIQASCTHVLLLTGTPTPNHVGELYQHLRTFWPQVLHQPHSDRIETEAEFEERYCTYVDTRFGRHVTGSKGTGPLRKKLAPYVLHRSKATVLPELPPVQCQDIPLGMSAHEVDARMNTQARTTLHQLHRLDDDKLLAALQSAPGSAGEVYDDREPIATVRRKLGELKVEPTVEWVIERLACGVQKIILFGWHTRALGRLHTLLAEYEPVIITGDTPSIARSEGIEQFQTRPQTRVFIGQILAAGTAITLTAASEVAIVEPSWVPGENQQAIDRAHRLGQRDSVLASFLYLPGTLDQRIMRIFRRKASETKDLIGETTHDDDADPTSAIGDHHLSHVV